MYKKVITTLVCACCALAVTNANAIGMAWQLDSTSTPVKSIEFPLTIVSAKPENRFYYAYQFGFTDGKDIGYTGMQPQEPVALGHNSYRIVFSSFRPDSEPLHANCESGADGGKGVSCATIVSAKPGKTYKLRVEKKGNIVTGTVIQPNGKSKIVGKWSVTDTAGDLALKEGAWIENYSLNSPGVKLQCNAEMWPYYEVKFGAPSANNGKIKGTISDVNNKGQGDMQTCPDAVAFIRNDEGKSTAIGAGYQTGSGNGSETTTPSKPTKPGRPGNYDPRR